MGQGEGSLPRRPTWLLPRRGSVRSAGSGAGAPVRVLIVDDHPVFRRAARELLEARGFVVVGDAGCSATALEAVKRLEPEGVLLDIRLGEESGHELAHALTRCHPAPAVLLVSVLDVVDGEERALACGARGFVLKNRLAATDLDRFWRARN
jgi:DNA-binding NarL/FixJ family response regulator